MLVNSNEMLLKAKKNHYAVPHFNINNLEWTKYILEECNELNIPVILGVSEGAAKYMGGFNTIYKMTEGLIQDLNIKIPVCLHVDHAVNFVGPIIVAV
jgi:fructose/tagatose bisphosphate aldolase